MKKRKKRLPIDQLRMAGKKAQEMLVEKGLAAPDSIIEKIRKMEDAPMLPGRGIEYLPHKDTLKMAQRLMYDILILWKDECAKNQTYYIKMGRSKKKMTEGRAENVTEFFKFAIQQLRTLERKLKKEMDATPAMLTKLATVPVMGDVFRPMRKHENTKAILRFFVDSFAVAVVLKQKHSTSEFADWFLDWTNDLQRLWMKPEERGKIGV